MSLWRKLLKGETQETVDYYQEGVELLKVGKYHEALTSFRLALRESPDDPAVLQQMAITYTRIGMTEEAIRMYRAVLAKDEGASGAHYGLAFLLLRDGRQEVAAGHLRAFLDSPPTGEDADRHIEHARATLDDLSAPAPDGG